MNETFEQVEGRETRREEFLQSALHAWVTLKETGTFVSQYDADHWLRQMVVGQEVAISESSR